MITSREHSNDQRLVLSAAAVCRVDSASIRSPNALQRDAAAIVQTCDDLAHEQVWLNTPRVEESETATEVAYSFRHALLRQVLF